MIQHLRTKPLKALPISNLTNLGQINVFCGKNNSGKSTILETLAKSDLSITGLTLTNDLQNEFLNVLKKVFLKENWSGSLPGQNALINHFNSAMAHSVKKHEVIFDNDEQEFCTTMENGLALSYGKDCFHIDFRNLSSKWRQEFDAISPARILIPPKRIVASFESAANYRVAKENGEWLLNQLFYCKNQSSVSNAYALYNRVRNVFEEVSAGFTFDIVLEYQENNSSAEYQVALKFKSINASTWINADDCGLGLRELLVMVYFALEPDHKFVLIEEPENHVHPEMQRRLLRFFSEGTEKQYFISTHSNIFLNTTYVDKVFHVAFRGSQINVSDATSRTAILNELGYSVSDNLVSDLIILVEGPKDTPVIEEYLKKLEIDKDFNVKIWPLGGDIMSQVDLTVFKERYKVIALIDRDPNSEKIRKDFTKKCKELDIPVTRLKRYAIENYFSIRALKVVFKSQIPNTLTDVKEDISLEKQIGINVKNNNRKIAAEMKMEEIKGTDLYKFFLNVQKLCTQNE